MSLAELERLALAHNPTIKELAANAAEASALEYQVGLKANPTAGYTGSQLADRGTDQHLAFVEQEFVRGGKLELNRQILAQTHQVSLWNVETQKVRVLTDVRARFYEALAAQRQVELTTQFLDVIDRGVTVAEDRRKAGEGTAVEVLQARTQREQIDLARQRAEVAFRGAWQELTAVAGVPTMAAVPLVAELRDGVETRDWDAAYARLLAGSPELAAARARVQEARIFWERQRVQAVPNVTAQLAAGYDNGTDNSLINLQIGAPIPVHNRNQGNISAAYAAYCRATQEVKRIEMAIKARLARGAQDYDAALASVNKFEQQILPQTREALDLSEQAYTSGELDFLQTLIIRRTYFDSNIEYVQALGELAQARTQVDGFLLTGGLDAPPELNRDDSVRGQAFSQQ